MTTALAALLVAVTVLVGGFLWLLWMVLKGS